MPETIQSLKRRFDITEMKGPEVQCGFAVFKERCAGFLEISWQRAWRPEELAKAFEQYGFDCYLQGTIDGATTAAMLPELPEFILAERRKEDQGDPTVSTVPSLPPTVADKA